MKLPKLQRNLFDPLFCAIHTQKGLQKDLWESETLGIPTLHYPPIPVPGNLYPMFSKPII